MLHVLNGDSLLKTFKHTHLAGDVLIWRECMVEGPVSAENSKRFWEQRADFISEAYHSSPAEYSAKFLRQLHKLDHVEKYKEINLWFEFDLFCQVNMLCTLEVIRSKTNGRIPIYWITPDQSSETDYFAGYANLNATDLAKLFQKRRKLNPDDIAFFAELWEAYKHDHVELIKQLIDSSSLPYVKAAFSAHLERLPQKAKLNRIEQKFQEILDDGITDEKEICLRFWETESIYGFGDLQVIHALNRFLNK